jgi:hypothetical protein
MPSHFDEFLFWLSPDPEEAAKKYEELYKRLIRFFTYSGCNHPAEELADIVIDRSSKKIAEKTVDRSVDASRYCFGVARYVLMEYRRVPRPQPLEEDVAWLGSNANFKEQELTCLDACLSHLSERDRDLITSYFQQDGGERIRNRKDLAKKEGGANRLRLRIFRIKDNLRNCVVTCLDQDGKNLAQ